MLPLTMSLSVHTSIGAFDLGGNWQLAICGRCFSLQVPGPGQSKPCLFHKHPSFSGFPCHYSWPDTSLNIRLYKALLATMQVLEVPYQHASPTLPATTNPLLGPGGYSDAATRKQPRTALLTHGSFETNIHSVLGSFMRHHQQQQRTAGTQPGCCFQSYG
jgi:hypothetical protein